MITPSSTVAEASRPDIHRSLRLTFEDDLLLPRYHDPIAIQPEPESVTTHSRRDAIIRATTLNPGMPLLPSAPAKLPGSPPSDDLSFDGTSAFRSNSPLPFPGDGFPSPQIVGSIPPKVISPPLLYRDHFPVPVASPGLSPQRDPEKSLHQRSSSSNAMKSPVANARRNNSSGKPPSPNFLQTPPSGRIAITQQQNGMEGIVGSPSFMAQPLEGSAVGRPRAMSTIRGPSPLALFKPPSSDHVTPAGLATPLGFTPNTSSLPGSGDQTPRKKESDPVPGGAQSQGGKVATDSTTRYRLGEARVQYHQQQQQQQSEILAEQQPGYATPLSAQRTMSAILHAKQQLTIQTPSQTFSKTHKGLQPDSESISSPYHATPRARKKTIMPPLRMIPTEQPLTTQQQQEQPRQITSPRDNFVVPGHQRRPSLGLSVTTRNPAGGDDFDGSPCSPVISPTSDLYNPVLMDNRFMRQSKGPSSGFDKRTSSFSWNESFIEAIDNISKLTHSSHADERLSAYENLSRLAGDFNDTVRKYARIIISEVYLPPEKKQIKPCHVGGIVGGDKFIVHGIMFKFAMDSKKMYGGDEHAAKVAGHDLKGLVHLYNCWERGIHFPMMTIVDYRGFRIVGMPLLPINGTDTLVYGSNDAGKTIKTCPFLDARLRSVGEKLNLKPHLVGKQDNMMFYTPIDLEGHFGTDGRYYLLDFSRLFPPQSLDPAHRMGHLYQLLRPEFVRMYEKPLCSDALSSFICPNHRLKVRRDMAEQIDNEIDEATSYLTGTVVQAFAQRLVRLTESQREDFQLIMLLHEAGINCRFLGLVYAYVANFKDEYWCVRLLIQMAARVIKSDVNALLRRKVMEVNHPGECEYRNAVVQYLNLVLGNSLSSENHWKNSLVEGMKVKFPGFGDTSLGAAKEYVRKYIFFTPVRLGFLDGRCLLLRLVSKMLGLRFSASAWEHLSRSGSAYERVSPIINTDLEELQEVVKEMHIASHSSGFVLKMKAMLVSQEEERRRLLDLAVQQFNRALGGNPDNKVTLRNLGDCLVLLDRVDAALNAYMRCLIADPEDPNTLYKFAIVLDKMGALDAAEEYYLRSLELFPFHSNCCFAYADFLCYQRKNFSEAERFYLKAVEVDESNYDACNNYAIFLVTVKREYEKADLFFQKAVNGAPHNITYCRNYASFMLHIRRNIHKADIYAEKAKALSNNHDCSEYPSPILRHSINDVVQAFSNGTVPFNLPEI